VSPTPASDPAPDATGPHRFLNPETLAPPVGFSHVALPAPGRWVCVAGQTAHRADGTLAGETMAAQADAALANLVTALAAAGAQPVHLVTLQIFVTDVAAYRAGLDEIGRAWRAHLGRRYPAVSLFGVAELFDPDALIELVAAAVVPQ
jgi:enamine deaminase RidA (YjgF/YER057c/UK114 family)